MAEPLSAPDPSALCAGCGLCCDGTLYTRARAGREEFAPMAGHGLRTFEAGGKDYFHLPCPAVEGGRCTIYEDRFAICRSFRCALLRRYEAGEVDLAEARRAVETAKRLLADLASNHDGDLKVEARRALAADAQARMRSPGGDPGAARLYLELVALERFLETRFRNPKRPADPAQEDEWQADEPGGS